MARVLVDLGRRPSNIYPHGPPYVCSLGSENWFEVIVGLRIHAFRSGFSSRRKIALAAWRGQINTGSLPITVCSYRHSTGLKTLLVCANYFCNSEHIEMGIRKEEMHTWEYREGYSFAWLLHCLCYLNILLCKYKDRKWVIQNLANSSVFQISRSSPGFGELIYI